eukprot:CAMPEP_0170102364 /NCGR_PEP_ID=MMETSP0020_2-20130122/2833_1 /TAXON_ID=98059 /ORGANISM="Dinobryon sp., Strain UTEXLB2267" /LENGTH=193 /DNA_ID=CAMNT_0010325683 /DNA_START=604 /DNA_END=1185 /DNA_ORIENTATION=+
MNRRLVDCQNAAQNIHGRKYTGRFSIQERTKLIGVIRRLNNLDENVSINDMPESASWQRVASEMGYERYPIDYERYWMHLKIVVHSFGTNIFANEVQGNDIIALRQSYVNKIEDEIKHLQFFESLEESNVPDESEVNWKQLTKALQLKMDGLSFWNHSVKRFCPPDNPTIVTFREKLEFLLEIQRQKVEFITG